MVLQAIVNFLVIIEEIAIAIQQSVTRVFLKCPSTWLIHSRIELGSCIE